MTAASPSWDPASSWPDYVLSPARRVIPAARWAVVSADPVDWRADTIAWRDGNGPIDVTPSTGSCVLLDFGRKTTGHLILETPGTAALRLTFTSGPVLDLMKFEDEIIYHSACGCWRDPTYRALRFLAVRITDGEVLPPLRFSLAFSGWPGEYAGWFLCNDDRLNRIWYAGAYTTQLCIQPHEYSGTYNERIPARCGDFARHWRSPHGRYVIWDGPRRDREVWVGDLWPEMHAALYAFHCPEVVRSSLLSVAVNQAENGMIPGSGITLQPFAEYACWWLCLLDRYYLFTGDADFLREVERPLRRMVGALTGALDAHGGFLDVEQRRTWAWTLSRRGVVTGSQCVAQGGLAGSARVLRVLGDEGAAADLERRATELAKRIRGRLWNETAGTFRDSLDPADGQERVSADSNALACLFGVAHPEQAERAMRYLRDHLWTPYGTRTIDPPEPANDFNWSHNHNIWPFVSGLELEARFDRGDHTGAMELLRTCWGNMIDQGTETFWEMVDGRNGGFVTHRPIAEVEPGWDGWDSYCHGWSAGVVSLMPAYILGIRPLGPGFRRFTVAPCLGDLTWAEGVVPTPHGPIHARVERDGASHRLRLRVPEGTIAQCAAPGQPRQERPAGEHDLTWTSTTRGAPES